jgi:hypothetical protein
MRRSSRIAQAAVARQETETSPVRFARPFLAILALMLVAGAACSERQQNGWAPYPDATFEAPANLPPGLAHTLVKVAQVRELDPPPDLKAELVARSDLPTLLDRLLTDDDKRIFAATTTLYRLLGFMRNDQDYLSIYRSFGADAVLGLYSPPDKTLWVVHPDGADIDFERLPRQEEETLAHELVHALQDYHFDLQASYDRIKDNMDVNLAWTAAVEGDAVTHENLYSRQFMLVPAAGRAFLVADAAQIGDVPAPIVRELYFPYTSGAAWVADIRSKHGTARVNELLSEPPAATSYVLHPERMDNGWKPEAVALPDLSGALGSGWSRESGGTFGEFQLRNYLRQGLSQRAAEEAGSAWAGDHYDVYVNGSQAVAVFRVVFAAENDARGFMMAHQELLRSARTSSAGSIQFFEAADGDVTALAAPRGREVVFTIGTSQAVARAALESLLRA